ncbi:MAG: hypothetical protein AAFZ52_15270 [Bacteroidota bacterium]
MLRHLLCALSLLLLTACPPDSEVAPAFLLVEDLVLDTPELTEDISEVWAFADDVFVGAFPLPARIPVPNVGNTEIRLEAGVRQNGVLAAPEIYEFYTPVIRNLELVAGESIDLGTLTIGYRADVQFALLEDFESSTSRAFTQVLTGDTVLQVTNERVRSGAFSGKLSLSERNSLVEIASQEVLRDLTTQRPYVWLEMDFLSQAPVVWTIVGADGTGAVQGFAPGFNPQDEWTKIYFNLSEVIVRGNLSEYRLLLSTLRPSERETADIYLDNIRLVYF